MYMLQRIKSKFTIRYNNIVVTPVQKAMDTKIKCKDFSGKNGVEMVNGIGAESILVLFTAVIDVLNSFFDASVAIVQ